MLRYKAKVKGIRKIFGENYSVNKRKKNWCWFALYQRAEHFIVYEIVDRWKAKIVPNSIECVKDIDGQAILSFCLNIYRCCYRSEVYVFTRTVVEAHDCGRPT